MIWVKGQKVDRNRVDTKNNLVEMTFKTKTSSTKKKAAQLALADFSEGQNVVAIVKKVEDYGIFLRIEGSNVSGLCHKSEVSLSLSFTALSFTLVQTFIP